jgi:hypothetical protein
MVFESQGFASLQLEAGECPLERLGRLVALRHEGIGALAQLFNGRMAGMAQDTARIDAEHQLDLIDPAGVDRREVKDEPVIMSGVEGLPYGLRAVSVQVVPHDVYPTLAVGLRDLLHKGHEVDLGAPIRATAQDASGVHVHGRDQGLGAVAKCVAAPPTDATASVLAWR